jgi:hypothetical protein
MFLSIYLPIQTTIVPHWVLGLCLLLTALVAGLILTHLYGWKKASLVSLLILLSPRLAMGVPWIPPDCSACCALPIGSPEWLFCYVLLGCGAMC